ncbi:MAG: extracellular solute-binding protein [Candidatus Magasanikbacteria bacterium]
MKKQKLLILPLILLTILTSGLGCKGLTEEQKASVRPITLNYWTIYNDTGFLQEMANAYKQDRPYVTIKIKKVRVEEFEDLFVNALADDVGPDIVSINTRDLGKYQARLLSAPEQIQMASVSIKGTYAKETVITQDTISFLTPNALKSNFVSTVYDDVVINNKIYGVPLALDVLALYYNKDLLDQAGIPLPPNTWEELMDAVRETTIFNEKGDIIQSGAALGTGKNIPRSFDILSLLMLQGGIKIAQGNTVTFDSGLKVSNSDSHPTMNAIRFYTDFANQTKDVYTWNKDMNNALDAFASGKVVFYFGFAYDYPLIKSRAPQINMDIVPVPQLNPSKPVNIANYYIESVVGKTKNRNAAWDFVRFITTQENIKKYTDKTKRPTPLRAQIKDQEKDLVLAPFVSTILQAENWYHGRDKEKAEQALQDLIFNYLQPIGGKQTEAQRNVELIQQTAKVIQQTM